MKRQCKICKTKYTPKNYWQKYCSKKCKMRAWYMKTYNLVEKEASK